MEQDKLKQLFVNSKQELEDNGFSQRVMNSLPEKKRNFKPLIMLFSLLAAVAFFYFLGLESIMILSISLINFSEALASFQIPKGPDVAIAVSFIVCVVLFLFYKKEEATEY